ncbi:hypothetical protein ACFX2I_001543 [Malus domestica]
MRLPQVLASALSDNFTSPIKPRLGNIVGVIKPSVSRADSGTNLVLRLFRPYQQVLILFCAFFAFVAMVVASKDKKLANASQ